ncbi:MAG: M20/M25/M40 family metallo-hydrolase [Fusobacterium varium]|uniref:M20/M25/M40 family metallo-hydrolase n=1 Tax=Fusobacterium varium TaxID=856 RepID=UPI00242E36DA|nr:M20/M25/M40 family metallo-hydrolase [Fusobacterium varium]UYI77507.1 MAG: M20/M25/M40 family metallo-hydrolase [Fusobacterium varium]
MGCGHDGHAATLLTFAVWLKEQQDKGVKFKKSIVLIFQPGEEGKGGARYLSVHEKFSK